MTKITRMMKDGLAFSQTTRNTMIEESAREGADTGSSQPRTGPARNALKDEKMRMPKIA
jgi:hypothetical protein